MNCEMITTKLTVVIPVYNGMPFLQETVNSILCQTYPDFRLLIINDGSKDSSAEYLNSLTDPRLEVVHQENIGLCHSLNKAIIKLTESEFIARLDQDDVSFPTRLEEQINFLSQNPDYAGVFSNIIRIGADGREFGYYQSSASDLIGNYESSEYGSIVHSTMMLRREKFLELGGYRQEVYPVDDYDLLLRLSEKAPLAVMKKPLVKYRIHGKAGTFKSFWQMDMNTRYVEQMHCLRTQGEAEIPLEKWLELNNLNKISPVKRLAIYLHGFGKLYFREAGKLIGEGKKMLGILYLFVAFCCYPKFVAKRLSALSNNNNNQESENGN